MPNADYAIYREMLPQIRQEREREVIELRARAIDQQVESKLRTRLTERMQSGNIEEAMVLERYSRELYGRMIDIVGESLGGTGGRAFAARALERARNVTRFDSNGDFMGHRNVMVIPNEGTVLVEASQQNSRNSVEYLEESDPVAAIFALTESLFSTKTNTNFAEANENVRRTVGRMIGALEKIPTRNPGSDAYFLDRIIRAIDSIPSSGVSDYGVARSLKDAADAGKFNDDPRFGELIEKLRTPEPATAAETKWRSDIPTVIKSCKDIRAEANRREKTEPTPANEVLQQTLTDLDRVIQTFTNNEPLQQALQGLGKLEISWKRPVLGIGQGRVEWQGQDDFNAIYRSGILSQANSGAIIAIQNNLSQDTVTDAASLIRKAVIDSITGGLGSARILYEQLDQAGVATLSQKLRELNASLGVQNDFTELTTSIQNAQTSLELRGKTLLAQLEQLAQEQERLKQEEKQKIQGLLGPLSANAPLATQMFAETL